jgi:exodeoxyribonuclease VII large subunit
MTDTNYTVTELNNLLKDVLKKNSPKNISVKGELSGYKKYNSTIYATLKDDSSSINLIKFRVTEDFQNGNMIIATGSIEFYSKNGNINLMCSKIELAGEGLILKKLYDTKIKYQNMGYFDNKKEFPKQIKSIGIVTASSGAALQDILFVLNSNKFDGKIFVKNSPVQGIDCPKGICSGIKYFNSIEAEKIDLIMITRGGGSIDDLMGFSDPSVIEEIYKSEIFVMSAVGHEVDNMLSDFVADIRAPTPSIGAEMISKAGPNKILKLESYKDKVVIYDNFIRNKFDNLKRNLFSTKKKTLLKIYDNNNNKIFALDNNLDKIIYDRFLNMKGDLNNIKSNIDLIKTSQYNAILIKKNKPIKSIDDIDDGIYYIKIAGKMKKIEVKILD